MVVSEPCFSNEAENEHSFISNLEFFHTALITKMIEHDQD